MQTVLSWHTWTIPPLPGQQTMGIVLKAVGLVEGRAKGSGIELVV